MITYRIDTMGGQVAGGIPSEDVAISIAIDRWQYIDHDLTEYGIACAERVDGPLSPLGRRFVQVIFEELEGDGIGPSIYIGNSERADARVNQERRKDCCGAVVDDYGWKLGHP